MNMTKGNFHMETYYKCCDSQFFIQVVVIAMLVLFAGLVSGLTLGLMSMSLVDLEVLAKSGTPKDRLRASKILPVVKKHHLLLCTLLISNAAAMEALPVFLDKLVPDVGAVLISVTLILLFGEIIPQSVCTRYGLAIGAAVTPMVRVLVWICLPIAYPVSKVLDHLLGNGHEPLFRRAELKTLVHFHGTEAGKGGDLSLDETTIIAGVLELTEKTARDAMTPISETFAIDVNAKLDRGLLNLIVDEGHSRVPVYYENPKNIIGLILVRNLLTLKSTDDLLVKNITIRRIPRVSEAIPLYDILNEFQKGLSHMAIVIRRHQHIAEQTGRNNQRNDSMRYVRLEMPSEEFVHRGRWGSKRSLRKMRNFTGSSNISSRAISRSRRRSDHYHSEILNINENPSSSLAADEEVIGIITMEDVIEELLKEEIYDETDH